MYLHLLQLHVVLAVPFLLSSSRPAISCLSNFFQTVQISYEELISLPEPESLSVRLFAKGMQNFIALLNYLRILAQCTLLVRHFTLLHRVQGLRLFLVLLTRGNIAVLTLYELFSSHMYYESVTHSRALSLMLWARN